MAVSLVFAASPSSLLQAGLTRRQAVALACGVPATPALAGDLGSTRPQPSRAWRSASREESFLDSLLQSSAVYAVKVDSTAKASPSARQVSTRRLVRALGSQRAIFLGEHHPDERDHLLQAALLRRLQATGRPLAVGLEAVQRQFQPVLDDYIAGIASEAALFTGTDWQRRWYWSFDAYAPVFRVCREYGVKLIALDVDSEAKAKVELGGLAALDEATLLEYIPDRQAGRCAPVHRADPLPTSAPARNPAHRHRPQRSLALALPSHPRHRALSDLVAPVPTTSMCPTH